MAGRRPALPRLARLRAQGFAHVRTVALAYRRSGALYQRLAGSTGAGPRYLGVEAMVLDENGNLDRGWTCDA